MPLLAFFCGASTGVAAAVLYHFCHRKIADVRVAKLQHAQHGQEIMPDLVHVHSTIAALSDQVKHVSDLQQLPFVDHDREKQYMFNFMPIWRWQVPKGAPTAEVFWKLAHAVSRDQNRDDWVAPHMTLHSRSCDFPGLAKKFLALLSDLKTDDWREILFMLRDEHNWILDEDHLMKKPSSPDHYVLHKAKIELPANFRAWLETNQDPKTLQPRKQDREAARRNAASAALPVPVLENFHVSLYSFRAAHSLDSPVTSQPCSAPSPKSVGRVGSYSHDVANEDALLKDLATADWTLVLLSPGWTGTPSRVPRVFAAVKLADLASGRLQQLPIGTSCADGLLSSLP